MRKRIPGNRITAAFCGFLAVMLCASLSLAAHHKEEKTTASDVKEEILETYDVLKSYTLDQRDEAMVAAQDRINELDAQIARMQEKIDNKWQDMSQATRERTRRTLDTLRQQREELSEWFGGLRYSSQEAWEEVKKGFADSYDRLEDAVVRAGEEFEQDKSQ